MTERFDAIVIGAGVAGLAAARDLAGAGKRVCILEARQRIGGRIWTLHTPDLPLPIELGAEFIHGEAEETFGIVQAAALMAYELPDNHWWSSGRQWRLLHDFWTTVARVRMRIPERAHDISFQEFLDRQRKLTPHLKRLTRMFVEGYHAAHADRISAASLRASDEELEEPKQFRIGNGYDAVVEWLRAGLDPERSTLRLGHAVTEIGWRRGNVEVSTARSETIRAPVAVITIPVGVWKSGSVEFNPPLRQKRNALEKLEVGHVVKVILRFHRRFWDEEDFLGKRAKGQATEGTPLNFVHAADALVPTWWTQAPVRAPLLTGWAGGHDADALLREPTEARLDRVLDSLASTFGVRRRMLDEMLDSVHMHDWQADPFSRGAYSYAAVGGENAHAALARPIAGTLFFAGEGTSSDQTGTVTGAIETGRRAARQVLKNEAS